MASGQGHQQPAQSPFKLFSRISWRKSEKTPKQGSFGEENNMYYHPELKRWVERGKEEEAEREAAGPPPPPVLSQNSITGGTSLSSKRSLSQRYVLQPNLSISSSMASMAGSLSQTDLPGLAGGGPGDCLSGPPSAIGSTAPSPPQSSNCLVPQGSFASGPSSATGLGPTSSFFVPAPPQRAVSQPLMGAGFFVPPPPTPEENGEDGSAHPGSGEDPQQQHREQQVPNGDAAAAGGGGEAELSTLGALEREAHANGLDGAIPGAHDREGDPNHMPAAKKQRASMENGLLAGRHIVQNGETGSSGPAIPPSSEGHQDAASSPGQLQDGSELGAPPLQPLMVREYRRLGGAGPNASDGGAAISLHEGMGVAPVGQHQNAYVEQQPSRRAAVVDDAGAPAVADVDAVLEGGVGPSESDRNESAAGWEAAQLVVNGAAPTATDPDATMPTDEAGTPVSAPVDSAASGGQTLHSQYYYQQYAYLYQYAQEQGYSEADAVSYAQYYAAIYAQQYEAQAPEGQLGDSAAPAASAEGVVDGAMASSGAIVSVGNEAAAGVISSDSAAAAAKGTFVEPAWQAAAVAVEDEAAPVETASDESTACFAGPDNSATTTHRGDTPYDTARAPHSALPEVPVVDSLLVSAAPLPSELTAAAAAAAHYQQSAVTAAVAAAAAAVEQQAAVPSGLLPAVSAIAQPGAPATAHAASTSAPSAAAALAPQLLIGRLGQLSSAATAAVASLGASVAATAPIAAALSAAATAAASTAAVAAVAAGSFAGLEGGLTEDDFERIMHPGDPAKLDGPLPWELPEHLRSGRKFLALCTNWQLANPGQPYAPQLLLQALEQPEQQQQQAAVGPESDASVRQTSEQEQQLQTMALGTADGGDVALAAEGGSGSAGGVTPAVDEPLSSYERACRLSSFGQPAAVLLTQQQEVVSTSIDSAVAAGPRVTVPSPPSPVEMVLEPTQPQTATQEPEDLQSPDANTVANTEEPPALVTQPIAKPDVPSVLPRVGTVEAVNFFEQLGEQAKTPAAAGTADAKPHLEELAPPDVASSKAVDVASQLEAAQPDSAKVSDNSLPRLGTVEAVNFFEELGEQAKTPKVDATAAPTELPRLGTVEAANFFEELADQAKTPPAATKPPAVGLASVETDASRASADLSRLGTAEAVSFFEELGEQAKTPVARAAAPPAVATVADDGFLDAAPAATAAAAAIDSVVQALEQLRSSAAAGDSGAVADPAAGTALLLQIQSSLAQATEALAGMGVDVSALATLAGAHKIGASVVSATEWTPSGGHKRPRVEASPGTPTRVAAAVPTSESAVATPLLAPGPPLMRPSVEDTAAADAAAVAPGERFQQLGRRLSDAVDGAAVDASQQQPVVVAITVVAAPEVDVAAVEERVRCEERSAWQARVAAVVDSEREAAALVIAAVERERDGLQQRVGDLEQALAKAAAEREEFLQRLEAIKAEAQGAAAAGASAEAERGALASQLSQVVAERDSLTVQLAAERSEKAALAEALASARAENEEVRQRYTARFSELTTELEATRASLAELQGEHDELLLCLGQESTKVAALTDALQDAGGDPTPLIEQIEAEYENMGLGGGTGGEEEECKDAPAEGEPAPQEQQQNVDVDTVVASEGWEGDDLQL